ncbi:hypothetical protein DdX_17016 [Ditylenchus destructor]|uniref:Uncharacterized protein n=1 Tax=Ditylenchus destructor TaxID=166010 RepID=A0AAD4MN13_9BILA|nr:hypothetical protein DdX_17016 [Ditylenchus destructor]
MLPTVSSKAKAVEKVAKVELETPLFRAPKKRRRAELHRPRPDPACNDPAATPPRNERKRRSASTPEVKRRQLIESAGERSKRSSSLGAHQTPATGPAGVDGDRLSMEITSLKIEPTTPATESIDDTVQDSIPCQSGESSQALLPDIVRMRYVDDFERRFRKAGDDRDLAEIMAEKLPVIKSFFGAKKQLRCGNEHTDITDVVFLREEEVPEEAKKKWGEVEHLNWPFVVTSAGYIPIEKMICAKGTLIFDRE